MDDMNAQIGRDRSSFEHVLGLHAFRKRTENGNRFVQFCAMNNLTIGSTHSEHRDIHKIIWISNDHKTFTQATKGLLGVKRSVCQTWTLLMTLPPSQAPPRAYNVSLNQSADGLGLVISEKKTKTY